MVGLPWNGKRRAQPLRRPRGTFRMRQEIRGMLAPGSMEVRPKGALIYQARLAVGLSLDQLAGRLGGYQNQLWSLEHDRAWIEPECLDMLAVALNAAASEQGLALSWTGDDFIAYTPPGYLGREVSAPTYAAISSEQDRSGAA